MKTEITKIKLMSEALKIQLRDERLTESNKPGGGSIS